MPAVHPKKTIDVGTFRVDALGDKKTVSVAYARSETYLTEVSRHVQ